MENIKKVKSPITTSYLTKDKVYQVYGVCHKSMTSFKFINDMEIENFSLLKESSHLNGKDWIVVE